MSLYGKESAGSHVTNQCRKYMRIVKYAIITLFIMSIVVYTWNWYDRKKNTDNTIPVIQMGQEQIDVSVENMEKDLLKDVVAKDDKDGDITDKIVVESISKFIDKENRICKVTYAVSDSDNHVVKATRNAHLTDYRSPRFVLKQPLCFETGSDIGVKDIIGAEDVIDGDISNKVKILSRAISTNMSGDNTITAQVTNSLGDTVTFKSAVVIKQENNLSPVIELSKNIEYLKVGDTFQPEAYVKEVEDKDGKKMSEEDVQVKSSSVKTKKPGCYLVEYSVTDKEGNEGFAYLTVMVEE